MKKTDNSALAYVRTCLAFCICFCIARVGVCVRAYLVFRVLSALFLCVCVMTRHAHVAKIDELQQ